MLNFSSSKIAAILLTCLLFILLAVPNVLSPEVREKMPSFLPSKTVNLGLDLQGGSYLLLELQFDRYMHEQMTNALDALRREMLKNKVMYQGLSLNNDTLSFTILKPGTMDIKDIVQKADADFELRDKGDNHYEAGFSDTSLRVRKLQLLEQSIEIVNRRVNETGTREPIIQRQGDNRIVLQVPGLQDPARLKEMLGKTAKMTFHLVDTSVETADLLAGRVPAGTSIFYSDKDMMPNGKPVPYAVKTPVMLSGDMLVDAGVTLDNQKDQWVVTFRFNATGAERFADITRDNVGKPFAVVLDDKVITAPVINTPILGGSGIIEGHFTSQSANDLAILLRAGALPAPLKVIEERSVGPSLGADSIGAGKRASLLGVVLVMSFMLINYGLFGIFADIALLFNLIFIMGALSLFQATLTLPGIAGMVLTLGMAVDANVLIYERIREELRHGKSPFIAIESGFLVARRTILDSNVTTLIAATLLFYFGTGTVKGFAVTLVIGILASMFTAILLTRLMIAIWVRRTRPKTVPI